jgi:hypothetical protein
MDTDIFQYFRDDDKNIEEKLVKLIEQYPNWSFDQVLEESQKIFAAIKDHYHKKEPVLIKHLGHIKNLRANLKEFCKQRDAIDNEIENLVMIHVNEPVYKRSLQALLLRTRENRKFCDEVFYPQLREQLSDKQLNYITNQLKSQVLS